MSKPDMTPISRFPDLEKPGRERLNQLFRLFILTTRGDILTRGATYLKRLAFGAAGTVLHSDGTDVEWAVLKASEVEVEELSTATYDDVQDFINFFGDRTILSGGTITAHGDADGKVVIAACTAWCKVTDSTTAIGKFFDYAGKVSQTLTDLSANFIYLDYNGGTPQVVVATALLTYSLKLDHILLGVVFRNGTATHIHNTEHIGISGVGRSNLHWLEHFLVHRVAGAVTSEAGTRQLAVTAGVVYAGLSRNATNAFNTNNSDTFSYWYYDGDAGPAVWVEVTGQTVISNTQYNALATGLANLSAAAKRGVHWVYLDNDGVHLHVVYGQGDYSTAEAELAAVPTLLPPLVTNYCVLIAKIIVQKDQDIMYISYPWTSAFQTSLAADHGSLAGLGDDDHAQYIKDTEFTAAEDVLVGTGSGTFAKKTPAELLAILSGDAGAAFSWNDKVLTALAGILATAETELTIDTDGEITVTQMRHKVDTFEDAASDDLSTINGGTTVNLIILRAEADARTVVIKHGTGNIWLQGKADVSLDDLEDGILLVWDSTNSKWFDVAAGGGGLANVVEDTTPQLGGALDGQGEDLNNLGVIFLTEQAAAEADVPGKGQIWVKTATPNEAWFVDDAGTEFRLGGKLTAYTSANNIFRGNNNCGDSSFQALVNSGGSGGLTATNIPYDGDVRENSLPNIAQPQFGKVILHNKTTSGTAEITGVDLTNNVLTVTNRSGSWNDNDVISTGSATCVKIPGGHTYSKFFDVDISVEIPSTATFIYVMMFVMDLSGSTVNGQNGFLAHSFETWADPKQQNISACSDYERTTVFAFIPIVSQKICLAMDGMSASGGVPLVRIVGYIE